MDNEANSTARIEIFFIDIRPRKEVRGWQQQAGGYLAIKNGSSAILCDFASQKVMLGDLTQSVLSALSHGR